MTLSCYVIDDEQHAIDSISQHITAHPSLYLAGSCVHALEALESFRSVKPDITFLDIDMPDISGLDLAKMIGRDTIIVFTTAHAAHAVEAYGLDAADYLLKPITFPRFAQCIDKISRHIHTERAGPSPSADFLFISTGVKNHFINIAIDSILYIKSLKNYVQIFLDDGKYITYLTLSELEKRLEGGPFVRTHKSFLLNISKATEFNGRYFILPNKEMIPLGKTYTIGVNLFLNKYLLRTNRKNMPFKLS